MADHLQSLWTPSSGGSTFTSPSPPDHVNSSGSPNLHSLFSSSPLLAATIPGVAAAAAAAHLQSLPPPPPPGPPASSRGLHSPGSAEGDLYNGGSYPPFGSYQVSSFFCKYRWRFWSHFLNQLLFPLKSKTQILKGALFRLPSKTNTLSFFHQKNLNIFWWKSSFSSWRRKLASLRSALMAFQWRGSPARAPPLTFGSSCSSCCRTKTHARGTSNGPTAKKASLSWWTPRPSPDSGGFTRTSQTWTMKLWAVHWGKYF